MHEVNMLITQGTELRTILITGGAGFIGSNFIRYFIEKYNGCFIINLDKLTYAGSLENMRHSAVTLQGESRT